MMYFFSNEFTTLLLIKTIDDTKPMIIMDTNNSIKVNPLDGLLHPVSKIRIFTSTAFDAICT